jgi:hypothetical protein
MSGSECNGIVFASAVVPIVLTEPHYPSQAPQYQSNENASLYIKQLSSNDRGLPKANRKITALVRHTELLLWRPPCKPLCP